MSDDWRNHGASEYEEGETGWIDEAELQRARDEVAFRGDPLETYPGPETADIIAGPIDLIAELQAAHRHVREAQQALDTRLDVRNDLLKIAVAEGYSLTALARTLRLSRQRVHQLTN